MDSLFKKRGGGKASKLRIPSEREGFALAVGCAMLWIHLLDCSSRAFFQTVANGVKDVGGTEYAWSDNEVCAHHQHGCHACRGVSEPVPVRSSRRARNR